MTFSSNESSKSSKSSKEEEEEEVINSKVKSRSSSTSNSSHSKSDDSKKETFQTRENSIPENETQPVQKSKINFKEQSVTKESEEDQNAKMHITRQSFRRSHPSFILSQSHAPLGDIYDNELTSSKNQKKKSVKLGRTIQLGFAQTEKFKVSNKISNTKYNILTFFPKNLYEQFRRIANFYFLSIAIITLTPASPFQPGPFIAALLFILIANMIKEIYEDILRGKEDRETNLKKTLILSEGKWEKVHWQKVKVGDIVKVECENPFPSDILLLSTSFQDGECYIDTKNLDGETNLKQKQALQSTLYLNSEEILSKVEGYLKCESPSANLTKFNGTFKTNEMKQEIGINIDQLLIRGTTLRNTDYVIGLIVYTGHETKSALNNVSPPSKRSSLEKLTNYYILFSLFFEIFIVIIGTSLGIMYEGQQVENSFYLPDPGNLGVLFIERFFTFIVLYSAMVPISLYVTLEIVRVSQARFINWDLDLYYEADDIPAKCKTSNLNEDLGRVDYLFSDKTGTLTRNEMVFKQCSINGKIYGTLDEKISGFKDELIEEKIEKESLERDFFTCLAVCHSVLPQISLDTNEIIYEASSPDELALVNGAKEVGFTFFKRTSEEIRIKVNEKEQIFKVLVELPFTSDRRRMSVIVQCPDKKIRIYSKGADSIMKSRLDSNVKNEFDEKSFKDLDDFARIGLRTLLICQAEIDEKKFEEWKEGFYKASTAITDREEKIEREADKIERNLQIIGVSAIEDKLQIGVPDTIQDLLKANIKIWVLTGDKRETAINIAKSCKLITDQKIFTLQFDDQVAKWEKIDSEDVEKDKKNFLNKVGEFLKELENEKKRYALVITGPTLNIALEDDVKKEFLNLALLMETVVCCRVNPLQKSYMVKLVKDNKKNIVTAAIGDGANDVTMIQKAHIGIGIKGKEGSQAAESSDYVIGQFRFLKKLLLVHGRWSYYRLGLMILYFFYKNVSVAMVNFWFSIDTRFSGQTIYDAATSVGYNLIYTALPPILISVFEQDLPAHALLKYPELYKNLQKGIYYNHWLFAKWFSFGILASITIYYIPRAAYSDGILHQVGHNSSLWSLSDLAFTAIIITANIRLALEVKFWYPILALIFFLSWLLYIIFQFIYSAVLTNNILVSSSNVYFVWYRLIDTSVFYFTVVLTCCLTILPDWLVSVVILFYFPRDYDIIREKELTTNTSNVVELNDLQKEEITNL